MVRIRRLPPAATAARDALQELLVATANVASVQATGRSQVRLVGAVSALSGRSSRCRQNIAKREDCVHSKPPEAAGAPKYRPFADGLANVPIDPLLTFAGDEDSRRFEQYPGCDRWLVVTRVFRVPAPSQEDLEPPAEIHWITIDRNADVAERAGAIAGGNAHAAAERNGEMGEEPRYRLSLAFGSGPRGGRGRLKTGRMAG